MKWSRSFIFTRREVSHNVENVSHKLLLKGGFIANVASGVYTYLPLGWRVLNKIMNIIREEMNRIGGQEIQMPVLTPSSLWESSGRWEEYGDDMFRVKDRKNQSYALSPTHEEVIAHLAANHIRSYRDLPQIWYQIQTKFRDEPRPRGGLLRMRQFIMKDSYSLDIDVEGLNRSYELHKEAYKRIFTKAGLKFFIVEASGGLMGEGESAEFMAYSDAGEDRSVVCDKCGYAANVEVAKSKGEFISFEDTPIKEVYTPGVKSVEEVSAFLNIPPSRLVKSMVFVKEDSPILVLVRGDYEISMEKLSKILGRNLRIASPDEVEKWFNAPVGFIGPHNVDVEIIADELLEKGVGFATGANREDYHIIGLNMERDVKNAKFYDIKQAKGGDRCVNCGERLREMKTIELGHIFKLGTKYTEIFGAKVQTETGELKPIIMGSYGIGVERMMATIIEQNNDELGIKWPISVAPFHIDIVALVEDPLVESVYNQLKEDFEVILDDRKEQPGVKFYDADLIGFPLIVTIGRKGLERGKLDVKIRRTGERVEVNIENFKEEIKNIWKRM